MMCRLLVLFLQVANANHAVISVVGSLDVFKNTISTADGKITLSNMITETIILLNIDFLLLRIVDQLMQYPVQRQR